MAAEDPSVSGVSGRYATALFELARDEKSIDAVKADLDKFDAMLADSADLKRLVRSPVFSADMQLKALAADYAAGKIKKEEAQQKYEELQSGLSKMSERIKSYEGNYNELSADFAKMMADFKAKGE